MMAVEYDVEGGGERLVDHRLDPVQEGRVDRVGCRLATAVHPAHRDADGGEARGADAREIGGVDALAVLAFDHRFQAVAHVDASTDGESLRLFGRGRDGEEERRGEQERSEEHTSELQSLMRNSYAVFCLKKKNKIQDQQSIFFHS